MSRKFTIYTGDGHYSRGLICPDMTNARLNAREGEVIEEGAHAPATFRTPAGQIKDLPPSPLEGLSFDVPTESWVERRTLEEIAAAIARKRATAVQEINTIRGETRKRFITSLPGQDMVYQEKERVARAWMDAYQSTGTEPDPALYGAIAAEVGPGLTGDTPYQVAYIYLFMAEQWRQLSPLIERVAIKYLNLAEQSSDATQLAALPSHFTLEMNLTLAAATGQSS